jgi:hypothetical protein
LPGFSPHNQPTPDEAVRIGFGGLSLSFALIETSLSPANYF